MDHLVDQGDDDGIIVAAKRLPKDDIFAELVPVNAILPHHWVSNKLNAHLFRKAVVEVLFVEIVEQLSYLFIRYQELLLFHWLEFRSL